MVGSAVCHLPHDLLELEQIPLVAVKIAEDGDGAVVLLTRRFEELDPALTEGTCIAAKETEAPSATASSGRFLTGGSKRRRPSRRAGCRRRNEKMKCYR